MDIIVMALVAAASSFAGALLGVRFALRKWGQPTPVAASPAPAEAAPASVPPVQMADQNPEQFEALTPQRINSWLFGEQPGRREVGERG